MAADRSLADLGRVSEACSSAAVAAAAVLQARATTPQVVLQQQRVVEAVVHPKLIVSKFVTP